MNDLERRVRAHVIAALRRKSASPACDEIASALDTTPEAVRLAVHALADQHRLALIPGTDSVWMVHPFSAVPTDFVVHADQRSWWANCVWDGLGILGLVGDGWLDTHSPESGVAIRLTVARGRVSGNAIVHFLVPARRFWEDIGFT